MSMGPDGVLRTCDETGYALAFQVTSRHAFEARPVLFNAAGQPPQRAPNQRITSMRRISREASGTSFSMFQTSIVRGIFTSRTRLSIHRFISRPFVFFARARVKRSSQSVPDQEGRHSRRTTSHRIPCWRFQRSDDGWPASHGERLEDLRWSGSSRAGFELFLVLQDTVRRQHGTRLRHGLRDGRLGSQGVGILDRRYCRVVHELHALRTLTLLRLAEDSTPKRNWNTRRDVVE